MHHAPRISHEPVHTSSRRRRKALALARIAASRTRVVGMRGSSRVLVTGAVVALGATSFVVASNTSIQIAPTLCSSSTATIRGSSRNDVLVGTNRDDVIWGGGGHDVIYGMRGNDRLCGGDGNDRMYGSSGDDYLDGGPGADVLRGDSGKRDSCLNGEQVAGCESVGTTTAPPTNAPPTTAPPMTAPATTAPPTTPPTTPPTGGRFTTLPVGSVLPTEQQCATRVRRMSENRPENASYNATSGTSPNDEFPRVTGNFTGTTDEILQWVACKWGIDEDLVRAQIALESWWTMTNVGDNGESFGLGQVRVPYHGSAFEDDNAKRSSAYNVDYTYQIWRDCFEGRLTWLNTVERGAEYRSGDAMGCTGVWFSGRWRTPAAVQYIARVDEYLRNKIWTQSDFGPSTPVGQSTPTTVAPTTVAPTTVAPTTVAPTTVAPTTVAPTTVAPTTTQAPTTTAAPTTTQPPSGAMFVETFNTPSGFYERFRTDVHFRDPAGANRTHTWPGDHNMACQGPTTTRNVSAANEADLFWWCAPNGPDTGHVMTSMGDIDGYTILSFSPDRSFIGINRVCWDINATYQGGRKWTQVAVIPRAAFEANGSRLDYISPTTESVDTTAIPMPEGGFMYQNWDGKFRLFQGRTELLFDWQQFFVTDKAKRYQHCLTDNNDGTVTMSQVRDTTTHTRTVNGSLPNDAVVIFQDDNYTPDKDGEAFPNYTWHWDNITIQ